MNESRRLPGGLRLLLEQSLELVEELRSPQQQEEDLLLQQLDDLKSRVSDALSEARAVDPSYRQEIVRPLKIADGILQYLADPTQRDARGRLRDVARYLQEALG